MTIITADKVKALRDMSGVSMAHAKRALVDSDGDLFLAYGFTRMYGLSVHIKGDRKAWERDGAERWKESLRCATTKMCCINMMHGSTKCQPCRDDSDK